MGAGSPRRIQWRDTGGGKRKGTREVGIDRHFIKIRRSRIWLNCVLHIKFKMYLNIKMDKIIEV